MIMVFNNRAGNTTNYSTVNVIETPVNADGTYSYSGASYAPDDFQWTYKAGTPTSFYAANISGAQRLPNGNTLICAGTSGTFFEVDYNGNMVWKYVNPVGGQGITAQGSNAIQNIVFRAERYAPDFAGLEGKTLDPEGSIETGSTFKCALSTGTTDKKVNISGSIYPNPVSDFLTISGISGETEIYNTQGILMWNGIINDTRAIDVTYFKNGLYFIRNNKYVNKFIVLNN
jgi:hypothetical protein